MVPIPIHVALGFCGGGHTTVVVSMLNTKLLVPTLTVLIPVYTQVSTPVLLGVVAGVPNTGTAAGETILG